VVLELRGAQTAANSGAVDAVVKRLLSAPHDPCDFRHFKERIGGYYPQDENIALALLDHAAVNPGPIPLPEWINVAKIAGAEDENRIRELLRLLAVDHYLDRDTEGRYQFRHPLLRRWWLMEQGLTERTEARG
jgi:hypothetical protein